MTTYVIVWACEGEAPTVIDLAAHAQAQIAHGAELLPRLYFWGKEHLGQNVWSPFPPDALIYPSQEEAQFALRQLSPSRRAGALGVATVASAAPASLPIASVKEAS